MKKYLIFLLLLSACCADKPLTSKIGLQDCVLDQPGIHDCTVNGIRCMVLIEFNKGGISCDWTKK